MSLTEAVLLETLHKNHRRRAALNLFDSKFESNSSESGASSSESGVRSSNSSVNESVIENMHSQQKMNPNDESGSFRDIESPEKSMLNIKIRPSINNMVDSQGGGASPFSHHTPTNGSRAQLRMSSHNIILQARRPEESDPSEVSNHNRRRSNNQYNYKAALMAPLDHDHQHIGHNSGAVSSTVGAAEANSYMAQRIHLGNLNPAPLTTASIGNKD